MNCVYVAGVIFINHGPGILSALICSGIAVWQATAGVNKLRDEMKKGFEVVQKEFDVVKKEFKVVKKEFEVIKKNLDCRVERYHESTIKLR